MKYLETLIINLPRTSSITIKKLKNIGINTYGDLVSYVPYRWEYFKPFSQEFINTDIKVRITGEIQSVKMTYARNRLTIQKIVIDTKDGIIEATFFNQPFIARLFTKGMYAALAGKIKHTSGPISIVPEEYEVLKDENDPGIHTRFITPVYSTTYGLSSKTIREKIFFVLRTITPDDIPELFPRIIVTKYNLYSLFNAYLHIHMPNSELELTQARKRLSFNELFIIQTAAYIIRKNWEKNTLKKPFKNLYAHDINSFITSLPYTLTNAQQKVTDEILEDLVKTVPMNRFLQGDVGSGKTVVAAIAAYFTYLNGYKTLFMAPTEILAQQHFHTINLLFKNSRLKTVIQTGNKKGIKTNEFDIAIGTHALLNVGVENVGLVIIDEQHRFGVAQRAQLKEKGTNAHLLTMTATPIPRTVSLTLYGELDLSVIDEMPLGRIPIKTYTVPHEKRNDSYTWMKKQMNEEKCQIFFICPLIEESQSETMKSVKAATTVFEELKKNIFPEYSVGLIHGKLKSDEKNTIMQDFKDKKYDILVSTSVVEVGIDIANASIIVIEGAERFGLAQLHQLRGRVGRDTKQSYCLLFTSNEDQHVIDRLSFFSHTNKGIELAQYDLKTRGPGSIFGLNQHGHEDYKIADFSDIEAIEQTKQAVKDFFTSHELSDFPQLKEQIEKFEFQKVARD